jgi:hypothetical protein
MWPELDSLASPQARRAQLNSIYWRDKDHCADAVPAEPWPVEIHEPIESLPCYGKCNIHE